MKKVLIAYDGSEWANAALEDLKKAGLWIVSREVFLLRWQPVRTVPVEIVRPHQEFALNKEKRAAAFNQTADLKMGIGKSQTAAPGDVTHCIQVHGKQPAC